MLGLLLFARSGRCEDKGAFPVPKAQSLPAPISKEITVIGWIDRNAIALGTPDTDELASSLNGSATSCFLLTTEWGLGIRAAVFTEADRVYANAWLHREASNLQPPTFIDDFPGFVSSQHKYKLLNRLKVEVKTDNGQITVPPKFHVGQAAIGRSPEPCTGFHFLLPILSDSEPHVKNGQKGITSSGANAYQLNQARVGFAVQEVDTTLNDPNHPNTTVGDTTPWIWSNIRVDHTGNLLTPIGRQIYPTYYTYFNGILNNVTTQPSPENLVALDHTSVIETPAQDP